MLLLLRRRTTRRLTMGLSIGAETWQSATDSQQQAPRRRRVNSEACWCGCVGRVSGGWSSAAFVKSVRAFRTHSSGHRDVKSASERDRRRGARNAPRHLLVAAHPPPTPDCRVCSHPRHLPDHHSTGIETPRSSLIQKGAPSAAIQVCVRLKAADDRLRRFCRLCALVPVQFLLDRSTADAGA